MQQKWYELVIAEQSGAAMPTLERLYNSYVLAMEEYNRSSDEYQQEHQSANDPIPVTQKKPARSKTPSQNDGQSKIA